MISSKVFVVAILEATLLGAAFTWYYFPQIQTKTVEVEKEVVHENVVTVTHTITSPSGVTDTTTTTTDHSTKTISDSKTAVVARKPAINVSALLGKDLHKFGFEPIYGVQVSKEFIGPITLGAFGLTNGVIGLTVGLTF